VDWAYKSVDLLQKICDRRFERKTSHPWGPDCHNRRVSVLITALAYFELLAIWRLFGRTSGCPKCCWRLDCRRRFAGSRLPSIGCLFCNFVRHGVARNNERICNSGSVGCCSPVHFFGGGLELERISSPKVGRRKPVQELPEFASAWDAVGTPWARPKELYALFDQDYPEPKDGGPRKAPFLPYLMYVPEDFTLSLRFGGGGSYSNGNMIFDAEGNMWSGVNWMAGSQSGIHKDLGGGLIKFTPNGTPLAPPILGFRGMGIDGIGWGTGITNHNVWISSFNGKVGVFDFQGRPAFNESDSPFKEKLTNLMGIGVARNGDV